MLAARATEGTRKESAAPPPRAARIQAKCARHAGESCENCKKLGVQRFPAPLRSGSRAADSPDLAGPSQALDASTRAAFERSFRHDFSRVRVHADARAAVSADAMGARAYTTGNHLFFARGRYAPGHPEGKRLLAHELAHVVQQSRGDGAAPSTTTTRLHRMRLEREADRAADAALLGRSVPPLSAAPAQAQFDGKDDPAKAPAFPEKGTKIIGPKADALVSILEDCTGLPLELDRDGLLVRGAGPARAGKGISGTAQKAVDEIVRASPGVIIDTDPKALGVEVGAFSHEHPGYQQIDVGNVELLAGASGAGGGLSACDAVLHEMYEAVQGRKLSEKPSKGKKKDFFPAAHAAATKVETGIRKDLGLQPRSKSVEGDTVELGQIDPSSLAILDSIVFGKGKDVRTQINVFVCHIVKTGKDSAACDEEVFATTVVKGVVRFKAQKEALSVFNKYAKELGVEPIKLPPSPKTKK